MSNANKNVGKSSGGASSLLPYAAVAAVVIIAVALFFMAAPPAPQNVPQSPSQTPTPSGSAAAPTQLPPVSDKMTAEGCKFVYGTVMDNTCSGGLFPLGEVQSTDGTKKFCCGKSVNLDKQATAPLPITPPAGYVNTTGIIPEVAVQNITEPLVGGDRDAHGCIPSAGYSWCAEKSKCLRTWEENCTESSTGNDTIGGVLDSNGCNPSAGYTWCAEKSKCLRVWEEPCSSLEPTAPANNSSVARP